MAISRSPETERVHSEALELLNDLEIVVPDSSGKIDQPDYPGKLLQDWVRIKADAAVSLSRLSPAEIATKIARAKEAAHYLVGENRAVELLGNLSGEINRELTACGDLRQLKFKVKEGETSRSVGRDEARVIVAKQVLEKKRDDLEKRILTLQAKAGADPAAFTTEDAAEYYTACMFLFGAMDVIEAVETGTMRLIGRAVSELKKKRDDLEGIDVNGVEKALNESRGLKLLPQAEQLRALTEERETARYLEGKPTTYLGKQIAEYIVKAVSEVSDKKPSPDELSPVAGLDLEWAARDEAARILGKRAEEVLGQAYQDRHLGSDKFEKLVEQVGERLPRQRDGEKTTDARVIKNWQALSRARWYLQETVPRVLSSNAMAIKGATETGVEKDLIDKVLSPDDLYELLDDVRIRAKVAENYSRIRTGELVVGEKGAIFRVSADGGKAELADGLSLEERVAVEILNSMGVHPDPFRRDPQTELAWNKFYRGTHNSIRELYPYDKNPRCRGLFIEAVGTDDFTLIIRNPGNPKKYLLGDQLQISGLGPEELLTRWQEIKGERLLVGANFFWNNLRKGTETGQAWGKLFEKGVLTPKDVFEFLGQDKYDYIPAGLTPLRDEILRALYRLADEASINQLKIVADSEGKLAKTNLLNEVINNGLRMVESFELTGLYFTGVGGKGPPAQQIEAMMRAYRDNHQAATDKEVYDYILGRTGIYPTGEIPSTYSEWRKIVAENLGKLLRAEKFSGSVDEFLQKVKERGLAGYKFRDAKTARLAELLIKDPISEIVGQLLEIVQRKTFNDENDWLMTQEGLRASGMLTDEETREKRIQGINMAVAEERLTSTQAEQLLERMSELSKSETFVNKLKTVDGWVHQRWHNSITTGFKIIGETITLTKWDSERSKVYEWVKRFAGASPFAKVVVAPIFLTMLRTEWLIVGGLPGLGFLLTSLTQAAFMEAVVTNLLFLGNEVFKFTRSPYNIYPYRPRAKSR